MNDVITKKIVDHIMIDRNNFRYTNISKLQSFLNGCPVSYQHWRIKELIIDKQFLDFVDFCHTIPDLIIEHDETPKSKSNYTYQIINILKIDLEKEFFKKEFGLSFYGKD